MVHRSPPPAAIPDLWLVAAAIAPDMAGRAVVLNAVAIAGGNLTLLTPPRAVAAGRGQLPDSGAGLPATIAVPVLLGLLTPRLEPPGQAPASPAHHQAVARRPAGLGPTRGFAPASGQWALARDGQDWVLDAGPERARLRDSRGLHYLRALLAAPGSEIAALDLAAGGPGLAVPAAAPLLDPTARDAYRRRIRDLDAQLAAADRTGDANAAERAHAERQALIGELRRATGLAGRPRRATADAERAGSTSPAPSAPPSAASPWPPRLPELTCSLRSVPAPDAGTSQRQAAPRGAPNARQTRTTEIARSVRRSGHAKILARPLADERRASGLVGDDREALRVCDWEPVLGERADLAADDGG